MIIFCFFMVDQIQVANWFPKYNKSKLQDYYRPHFHLSLFAGLCKPWILSCEPLVLIAFAGSGLLHFWRFLRAWGPPQVMYATWILSASYLHGAEFSVVDVRSRFESSAIHLIPHVDYGLVGSKALIHGAQERPLQVQPCVWCEEWVGSAPGSGAYSFLTEGPGWQLALHAWHTAAPQHTHHIYTHPCMYAFLGCCRIACPLLLIVWMVGSVNCRGKTLSMCQMYLANIAIASLHYHECESRTAACMCTERHNVQ